MKRTSLLTAAVACAFAAMLFGARALRADDQSAKITFARGDAWSYAKEGAPKNKLKIGSTVGKEDILETGKTGRLEVKLPDASVIRLGANAKAQMKAVAFQASPPSKQVSARLIAGNAWAKVTSLVGGDSKFEIETENAVAGVRGTTFRVDAHKDKSVLVRVYAGTVAAKGILTQEAHKKAGRTLVQGPAEITRDQWEKVVGKMMELVIAPDGTPGEPREFAESEEAKDEWAAWNKERDTAMGGEEH